MLRLRTIEERTLGELPATLSTAGKRDSRMRFWRSPSHQPSWARPALLGAACLAGLAYAWGSDNAYLEPFYGGAARSMSNNWHDFIFGAFDPAGTMTVDKLPGALWLQALSLRVLGFHVWAVVLPQILEGVATILVLYRAVRRLAGPVAGITAAIVLAVSPVTVALNRGNVSDSLLILLTVLAADATSSALLSGRLRTLLLAGVWVGLAFQAKTMQAWLVLPALAVAYLVAAPRRRRVRLEHVALAGLVTVAVSLSWMTVVSLVPAHERPYVDGTQNDSVYSQVFDYNGIDRIDHQKAFASAGPPAAFIVRLAQEGHALNSQTLQIKPSWHRLLSGPFGHDDGWLLPAALIAIVCVLLERRHTGRRDPQRAAIVLGHLAGGPRARLQRRRLPELLLRRSALTGNRRVVRRRQRGLLAPATITKGTHRTRRRAAHLRRLRRLPPARRRSGPRMAAPRSALPRRRWRAHHPAAAPSTR
jgi:4-amino-4-deoxy-L-arabinose transferase-like glycosyltransferase